MWLSSTLSCAFRRKGPRQSRRKKARKQETTVARKRIGRMVVRDGSGCLGGQASIRMVFRAFRRKWISSRP